MNDPTKPQLDGKNHVDVGQSQTPAAAATDADPKLIADRVRARMCETPFLRITARITHKDHPIAVIAIMSKEKMRTEVFEGTKCIAAISATGKRAQEFVPKGKVGHDHTSRNLIVEYDSSKEDLGQPKIGSPILVDAELACEFGEFTESWLASDDDAHPKWVAETIAASKFKGKQKIGEHSCLKFVYSVELPQRIATHEFYVDEVSMDLVRWDSAQAKSAPSETITRSREYLEVTHALSDAGWVWRLGMKDLVTEKPKMDSAVLPQ